ncbi:MAG: hypothetical protein ACK559_02565, partial [bacterium]
GLLARVERDVPHVHGGAVLSGLRAVGRDAEVGRDPACGHGLAQLGLAGAPAHVDHPDRHAALAARAGHLEVVRVARGDHHRVVRHPGPHPVLVLRVHRAQQRLGHVGAGEDVGLAAVGVLGLL